METELKFWSASKAMDITTERLYSHWVKGNRGKARNSKFRSRDTHDHRPYHQGGGPREEVRRQPNPLGVPGEKAGRLFLQPFSKHTQRVQKVPKLPGYIKCFPQSPLLLKLLLCKTSSFWIVHTSLFLKQKASVLNWKQTKKAQPKNSQGKDSH